MFAVSTAMVAEEEVAVEAMDLDKEMVVMAVDGDHLGMPIISLGWILLAFCTLLLVRRWTSLGQLAASCFITHVAIGMAEEEIPEKDSLIEAAKVDN